MTIRAHRLRTAARQLHNIRFTADLRAEMMGWHDLDDDGDDPWNDPDSECLHCNGDGMDPDCDHLLPRHYCG